jgi:Cohesin domain/Secretion system C-terminal sorting domain
MKQHYIFLIFLTLTNLSFAQVTFIAPSKSVLKGDNVGVEIRVKTRDTISALQFTLEWNASVLEFKSVDSVMLPSSSMDIFGLNNVSQGNLKFLWLTGGSEGINIPDSSMIFKLNFKAIGDKGMSSGINFTNSLIKIKALNPKIESLTTSIRDGQVTIVMSSAVGLVSDTEGGVTLHQNAPNPVENQTMFPFQIREAEEISFEIYDMVGRQIFQKKAFFNAGKHQIEMNTEGVIQKGVYIYGVRTKRGFISRTLVKI